MQIKDELPMMADERAKLYIEKHGLPQTDANILVASKDISDFYEETIQTCQEYKLVCNWLLGEVQAYLNKENLTIQQTKLTPAYLGKMISFIQDGTISSKQAKKVFECLMSEGKDPEVIIEEKGMKQISDPTTLTNIINEVLDANEQSIQDYAAGKDRAVGFLSWTNHEKELVDKANPKVTNQILIQIIKS